MTEQSRQIIIERANKTVWREGDRIVKAFVPGHLKSDVLKEAFNHALAEEAGLPVPPLLGVCERDGGWALEIQAVNGRTMAQAMADEPENMEMYMEQLVALQSSIHACTCKKMVRLKDKGIKAGGALTVNGGTFVLDTVDDAVHAGGNVTITGGEWVIHTGDDAIHADAAVVIQTGSISIPFCYEGVEGQSVTIGGGTLDITASDDGINAAGGNDGSGTGFGFGKQDQFASDGSCFILINGGTITIVSDGDSIDSNGSLTVNGGTLKLTCNGNGNTAIDTNGTFTPNGGSITTNDGSESGGGMGRGRGAMSGAKSSRNRK